MLRRLGTVVMHPTTASTPTATCTTTTTTTRARIDPVWDSNPKALTCYESAIQPAMTPSKATHTTIPTMSTTAA